MQCQHCGKSDWVTIGDQKYCASCGEPSSNPSSAIPSSANQNQTSSIPAASNQASVVPANEASNANNAQASQPATTASRTSVPKQQLSDLSHPQSGQTVATPNNIKPANSFHQAPVPASAGIIDLRQVTVTPPPAPPAINTNTHVEDHSDTVPAVTHPTPTPTSTSVPVPVPTPTPITSPAETADPQPKSIQAPSQPLQAPSLDSVASPTNSPSIQKFIRPDTIGPAHLPVPTQPPAPTLPNAVVTQIESFQKLVPPAAPASNPQLANQPQASSSSRAQNIMAATLAIMLMGSYVWLNNFNTLSVKAASQKAGIEASLPGYIPNSYNLSGPVAYGQGFVTLDFKSPNSASPLTITQRRSNWDSGALLQLFVHAKSSSYVSVASQGLTIYLYDNNQATWVNKGLQYVISGDTRLSRDQILRIAESL